MGCILPPVYFPKESPYMTSLNTAKASAAPNLGKKHICLECNAPFYDLGKDPAVCFKCKTVCAPLVRITELPKRRKKRFIA